MADVLYQRVVLRFLEVTDGFWSSLAAHLERAEPGMGLADLFGGVVACVEGREDTGIGLYDRALAAQPELWIAHLWAAESLYRSDGPARPWPGWDDSDGTPPQVAVLR